MARPGSRGVSTGRILSWAPLVALILLAAHFRLANLGELGARWDEDLTVTFNIDIGDTGKGKVETESLPLLGQLTQESTESDLLLVDLRFNWRLD